MPGVIKAAKDAVDFEDSKSKLKAKKVLDVEPEQNEESEEDEEERLARKAARKAARKERKLEEAAEVETGLLKQKKRKDEQRNAECEEAGEPAPKKPKATEAEAVGGVAYRKLHDIRVIGSCPDPIQSFESAGFNVELLKAVKGAGFNSPSAIQSQCWPLAMAGCDFIAVAKTGSGKTAGYLFPAFMLIRKSFPLTCKRGDGPIAVVLAPTRELAIQIEQEANKFGKSSGIVSACVYGGMPKGPQIRTAMLGMHVLIATPGRMNDFLKMLNPPILPLGRVRYFVLDEADRMLDMGFEPQIRSIIDQIPKDCKFQSIMFTATWPKEVKNLAAKYLKNPTQINIGASGEQLTANKDVEQVLMKVRKCDKDDKLVEVLKGIPDPENASVIVFANQKHRCDYIVEGLKGVDWPAVSIHGDKDQWERQRALERFSKGQVRVIVATDVAARGLDIKGVSHVINYDFPLNGTEDWVHRVGRTGRAGAKGTAVTFFDQLVDRRSAKELCSVLRGAGQVVPVWLKDLCPTTPERGAPQRRRWGGGPGAGGRGGGGRGGSRGGGGRGGGKRKW